METPDIISTILREKQLDVQGLSAKTEVSDKDLYKMINGYTKTMGIKTANKINAVFPEYSIEFLRKKKDNLESKESLKDSNEINSADRFEDIVARKVIAHFQPYLNKLLTKNDKIIRELAEQSLDVDELKDDLSEIKSLMNETHQALVKK